MESAYCSPIIFPFCKRWLRKLRQGCDHEYGLARHLLLQAERLQQILKFSRVTIALSIQMDIKITDYHHLFFTENYRF